MPGAHAIGVSEHRQVQRKRRVGDARQRLAKLVDRGVAEPLSPPLLDFAGEWPPHLLRAPAAGLEVDRRIGRLDADVPQRCSPPRFVIRPFASTACNATPPAGISRMKFDHITMDVSHTPLPALLPVWWSMRCSNSLSNSIVNAISACDSAVGRDGVGVNAREAMQNHTHGARNRALRECRPSVALVFCGYSDGEWLRSASDARTDLRSVLVGGHRADQRSETPPRRLLPPLAPRSRPAPRRAG